MKTLQIFRTPCTPSGTFGTFELKDESGAVLLKGCTCEPAGDPTAEANKNRPILPGCYQARMEHSPKFSPRTKYRRLPLLSSACCSEERRILIHGGNYAHDTQGCILVGEYFMRGLEGTSGVGASMKTLHALLDALGDDESFNVEIF